MSGYNEFVREASTYSIIRGRKVEMKVIVRRASHVESTTQEFGYEVYINGLEVAGYWPHCLNGGHTIQFALKGISSYSFPTRKLFATEKRELNAMAKILEVEWILRNWLKNI